MEVFFCLSGCRPARHGENGRAQRAARHGQMAHGLCLGTKARHEHGAGTARQAWRPVEARHRSGPARPDVPPGRAGTARWPCISLHHLLFFRLVCSCMLTLILFVTCNNCMVRNLGSLTLYLSKDFTNKIVSQLLNCKFSNLEQYLNYLQA